MRKKIRKLDQVVTSFRFSGSKEELRAFDINNKLISRRSIERLLEEFSGVVKKN